MDILFDFDCGLIFFFFFFHFPLNINKSRFFFFFGFSGFFGWKKKTKTKKLNNNKKRKKQSEKKLVIIIIYMIHFTIFYWRRINLSFLFLISCFFIFSFIFSFYWFFLIFFWFVFADFSRFNLFPFFLPNFLLPRPLLLIWIGKSKRGIWLLKNFGSYLHWNINLFFFSLEIVIFLI